MSLSRGACVQAHATASTTRTAEKGIRGGPTSLLEPWQRINDIRTGIGGIAWHAVLASCIMRPKH
eukprot:12761727-Heterocapsa_arctica.AAC.1